MSHQIHTAIDQETPLRLQEYGVGIFEGLETKSAWKKALKKGEVRVNGVLGTSGRYISGGETIAWQSVAPKPPLKPLILSLKVLYEDSHMAAIYKPAGLLVSGNSFKTVARALEQNLRPSTEKDACTPQPVHRLDYPTTGLLLVGKTATAIRLLNGAFEQKKISKTYLAICIGSLNNEGLLTQPIDGKPAEAHYSCLATVPSSRFGCLSLVLLKPKTGRRHQLRKQLAALGHPILGDQTYGVPALILKGKGLFLHAFSMAFKHPIGQENMYLEAPLPKRFLNLFPQTDTLL